MFIFDGCIIHGDATVIICKSQFVIVNSLHVFILFDDFCVGTDDKTFEYHSKVQNL